MQFAEINCIKKVHTVFALCITSLFWIMLAALIIALALLCTLHAFQLHNPQIFQRRSAIFLSDVEDGVEVSDGEVKLHQVFVGNLPFDIEEEQLTSLVSEKAGSSFASLRLARDRRTGRSRGFGYIDYEDKAEAEAAIGKLVGLELGGRELKIDFSEPRPERPRSDRPPQDNSVFIGNLDFSVGEDQILEMCNDILGDGVASRVRLATDRETGA
jgi:RNA recognition motif-containing protein